MLQSSIKGIAREMRTQSGLTVHCALRDMPYTNVGWLYWTTILLCVGRSNQICSHSRYIHYTEYPCKLSFHVAQSRICIHGTEYTISTKVFGFPQIVLDELNIYFVWADQTYDSHSDMHESPFDVWYQEP